MDQGHNDDVVVNISDLGYDLVQKALDVLSYLILTTILKGKYYMYFGEEALIPPFYKCGVGVTEVTWPKVPSGKGQSWGSEPRYLLPSS